MLSYLIKKRIWLQTIRYFWLATNSNKATRRDTDIKKVFKELIKRVVRLAGCKNDFTSKVVYKFGSKCTAERLDIDKRLKWSINDTLPVPGGPWMRATWFESARTRASCWLLSRTIPVFIRLLNWDESSWPSETFRNNDRAMLSDDVYLSPGSSRINSNHQQKWLT